MSAGKVNPPVNHKVQPKQWSNALRKVHANAVPERSQQELRWAATGQGTTDGIVEQWVQCRRAGHALWHEERMLPIRPTRLTFR